MRKALAAFVLIVFAFSAAAIAQDPGNNTGGSQNLCEGVTCSESSATCADGYAAKCSNSCNSATGQCSQCTPSCSGHDKTFCETAQCGGNEKTCPDGFKATCTKTCDNAARRCNDCEPSCAGHETATQPTNGTQTTTCPQLTPPSPDFCKDGVTVPIYSGSCITGYECKKSTATTCPTAPQQPQCPSDAYPEPQYDANKCITGYECRKKETKTCPTPPPFPSCDGRIETKHDNNGCAVGYECRPIVTPGGTQHRNAKWTCYDGSTYSEGESTSCKPSDIWKQYAEDRCKDRCNEDKSKCGVNSFSLGEGCGFASTSTCGNNICEGDEGACRASACKTNENGERICTSDCGPGYCPEDCRATMRQGKCGDTICDAGEDANSCPSDCKVPGRSCPLAIQCGDGSQAVCRQDGDRCSCDQCPITNLPPGCRQEKDEKGFVNVRCEDKSECREISQEERVACVERGGVPMFRTEGRCKRFECSIGGGGNNIFERQGSCPTREDWEKTSSKCAELGLRTMTKIENGCNIPTCVEKREEQCGLVPGPERERIENECRDRGARVVRSMDEKGCQKIECADENTCQRELPEEAYRACGAKGGEVAVKRDQSGCVIFSECLRRGSIEESYVEEPEGSLDPAELLQIALKLERLKVELDKLSRETKNIADYYKGTGSNEAERFERVSGMFAAATGKIDDIKNKIRDSADSLGREGLAGIRQDIKYVKDVMIKDILYMMLSNGDDVKKIKERSSTDCGSDEQCFGEALRLCKPMTFYPEGDDGPEVTITGLEDGKCVMKARLDDSKGPPAGVVAGGPPWEMTCRIEKYALGIGNPEEDVFPYCQGSMVELIKQFGTGGGGPPGIEGKCSGDSCREYCGKGPAEAKECLEKMGQYLPPEAKEGLKLLAEGRTSRSFVSGEEFGSRPGAEFATSEPKQFRQPQPAQPQGISVPSSGKQEPAACVGCLTNGICDPGECSGCADCMRK